MQIRWMQLFLDTPRADAATSWAYWAEVTGSTLSPVRGEHGQFATLLPAHGDAWLKVQAVAEGPGGVHLDIDTDDRAGLVAMALELGATVQACLDIPPVAFAAEVAFWRDLTGWAGSEISDDDEFVSLRRPTDMPVRILLQRRDAETERHVRAGAEVVKAFRQWTLMRDPAGRIYCLTDRDPATGTPY